MGGRRKGRRRFKGASPDLREAESAKQLIKIKGASPPSIQSQFVRSLRAFLKIFLETFIYLTYSEDFKTLLSSYSLYLFQNYCNRQTISRFLVCFFVLNTQYAKLEFQNTPELFVCIINLEKSATISSPLPLSWECGKVLLAVQNKKSSRMEVQMDVAGGKSSCPDVSSLMQSLQQALALEAKFQPKLQLPSTANNGGVSYYCQLKVHSLSNTRLLLRNLVKLHVQ